MSSGEQSPTEAELELHAAQQEAHRLRAELVASEAMLRATREVLAAIAYDIEGLCELRRRCDVVLCSCGGVHDTPMGWALGLARRALGRAR